MKSEYDVYREGDVLVLEEEGILDANDAGFMQGYLLEA